jgi:methionyl-tRNA formyltransferase
MVKELDAGPVYLKENLSLYGSTAEELYIRACYLSADMIKEIIGKNMRPRPQRGKVTIFSRRSPQESEIPTLGSIEALCDFIRMLDAEGYPKAFLNYKGFRVEFSKASLYDGKLVLESEIRKAESKK